MGSRATGVGQRLADRERPSGLVARSELGEQLEDARAALGRVVELDVQVRDRA